MRRTLPFAVLLVLPIASVAVVTTGCDSGGGATPLVAGTVDAAGGVLEVTEGEYAGLRIEVPPDALTAPVQIRIDRGFAPSHAGFRALGRAVVLRPATTEFRIPVRVSLPFNAGAQSSLEVDMLARGGNHGVVQLGPATISAAGDVATIVVTDFAPAGAAGELWVAERLFDGFDVGNFLPLQDGNAWTFENGLSIEITETTTEPNLDGVSVFRLRFVTAERDFGVYLTIDPLGFRRSRGCFQTTGAVSFQQIHDPALFVPRQIVLGQASRSDRGFTGYEPYGESMASFAGTAVARLDNEKPTGPRATPAGEFEDLLELHIRTTTRRLGAATTDEEIRMTLARRVGPIAVTAIGVTGELVEATVGGQRIGR